MATKAITRKHLYDQVWAEPMSRLAARYGLSDRGLAKICRKHNIPRPPPRLLGKATGRPQGEADPAAKSANDEEILIV